MKLKWSLISCYTMIIDERLKSVQSYFWQKTLFISFNTSYHFIFHIIFIYSYHGRVSRCHGINHSLLYHIITNVLLRMVATKRSLSLRVLYSFMVECWFEFRVQQKFSLPRGITNICFTKLHWLWDAFLINEMS